MQNRDDDAHMLMIGNRGADGKAMNPWPALASSPSEAYLAMPC